LVQKQAGSFLGIKDQELLLSLGTLRPGARQLKNAKQRDTHAFQATPARLVYASHWPQK
jgi:hypothetical protein